MSCFIAIDDLNDWTGFLGGHPQAIHASHGCDGKAGSEFRQRALQCSRLFPLAGQRDVGRRGDDARQLRTRVQIRQTPDSKGRSHDATLLQGTTYGLTGVVHQLWSRRSGSLDNRDGQQLRRRTGNSLGHAASWRPAPKRTSTTMRSTYNSRTLAGAAPHDADTHPQMLPPMATIRSAPRITTLLIDHDPATP